jgi:hypothetical protein
VTVKESGTTTEQLLFSKREDAISYRDDQVRRPYVEVHNDGKLTV